MIRDEIRNAFPDFNMKVLEHVVDMSKTLKEVIAKNINDLRDSFDLRLQGVDINL